MFSEQLSIWWMRLALGAMAAGWFWALSRRHPGVPGPGWWSVAMGCMALPVWLPGVAPPVGIPGLLTNLLTALSVLLGWLGLRQHFGFRLPRQAAFWGSLAYLVASLVLFKFWASSAPRLAMLLLVLLLFGFLTLRDIAVLGSRGQKRELQMLKCFTLLELVGLLVACVYVLGGLESLDPQTVERALPFMLVVLMTSTVGRTLINTALVTERLQRDGDRSRQALVQRGADSRALIEHLSAGVIVFRPDQTVARINSAARRFLGWGEGGANPALPEPLGSGWRLLSEDGSPMKRHKMPFERVLATGQPVADVIMGMPMASGPIASGLEIRWALCTAYPENHVDGGLRHVVLTFVDISSLRQAQAQQRRLQTQLAQSQKMEALGTLAGGVAHDFNNILAAILGNAELARQDLTPTHPTRECLHEISIAARRGRELVRQILAFSRQQPMERLPVDVSLVISESCCLLRAALPSQVELVYPTDLSPHFICADATQLGQVLLNLGTNAVHALGERGGRVSFWLDALPAGDPNTPADLVTQPGHGAVRIVVQDTGCGMDAATRERIFEPFFTTRPVGVGTGLGLAVVLGIVQTLGGVIDLKTQPGEGTTFVLHFPAVDGDAALQGVSENPVIDSPFFAQDASALAVDSSAGHPPEGTMQTPFFSGQRCSPPPVIPVEPTRMSDPGDSAPRHILYLDDDDTLVFLVRRLLERRGYRVTAMLNQQDAINAVRDNPTAFDLLLTDFNMPGMSGLDVAKAVLTINPALPVAVASGYITDELQADALAAGVREVVFKTDAVEDFCAMVARLIR